MSDKITNLVFNWLIRVKVVLLLNFEDMSCEVAYSHNYLTLYLDVTLINHQKRTRVWESSTTASRTASKIVLNYELIEIRSKNQSTLERWKKILMLTTALALKYRYMEI